MGEFDRKIGNYFDGMRRRAEVLANVGALATLERAVGVADKRPFTAHFEDGTHFVVLAATRTGAIINATRLRDAMHDVSHSEVHHVEPFDANAGQADGR